MGNPVLVAKMQLSEITVGYDSEGKPSSERLAMSAVYGKEGSANAQWSKWTPSGRLELHITNPEALGKATPGYYKVLLVPCGEND